MIPFLFLIAILAVYGLGHYYVFNRGLQAIPVSSGFRPYYITLFWTLSFAFIIGRILERVFLGYLSDALVWAGSIWLGAMLYFFLATLVVDLVRLSNHLFPIYSHLEAPALEKLRTITLIGVVSMVGLIVATGAINARHPIIRNIQISIETPTSGNIRSLHAVMMSDIHLGTLVGKRHFERILKQVNREQPDIVFLVGDVLDEDLAPVLRQNIGENLKSLNAPLGVYAVMGNHEHIGGAAAASEYLDDHGITLLRDTVVKVNDSFNLIGREDRDKARFGGKERKPLEALMQQADTNYPVILLDHQPYYLEEAATLGVDLQLSGHTHHGQMWPLSMITRAIYSVSKGYAKIGEMHAYVSPGVGTWGPPVRIGNRPEILSLTIAFTTIGASSDENSRPEK